MKYAVWFLRLVFGAWMIPAGVEHFIHIFPQPMGSQPLSEELIVALLNSHLFDIVKGVIPRRGPGPDRVLRPARRDPVHAGLVLRVLLGRAAGGLDLVRLARRLYGAARQQPAVRGLHQELSFDVRSPDRHRDIRVLPTSCSGRPIPRQRQVSIRSAFRCRRRRRAESILMLPKAAPPVK